LVKAKVKKAASLSTIYLQDENTQPVETRTFNYLTSTGNGRCVLKALHWYFYDSGKSYENL